MAQLDCLIYASDAEEREEFARSLAATGHAAVVARLGDAHELGTAVSEHDPDVVFVVLDEKAGTVLTALETLPNPRPGLVLAGPSDQSALLLRMMRLGVREYLPRHPDAATLAALVERLNLQPAGASASQPARTAAVLGVKGGVGATAVACQLAGALQAVGRETCLVDLNLLWGDVALQFDLQPAYTLADVARSSSRVDAAYLRSIATTHSSGVSIVAAPSLPEDAEIIRPAHVERSLKLLCGQFDWVVVDLPRTWDDVTRRALELADQLLLVLSLDLQAVAHARRTLELLDRLGVPREKIRLVANRCGKSDRVTAREAAHFLHRAPDARIPNDYAAAMQSVTTGTPVCTGVKRSQLRSSFEQLARRVHEWGGVLPPEIQPASDGMGRVAGFLRRRSHGAD